MNGNNDLVNNYVWRGMDQNSGFSVQPTLGMSYKGFSLSVWGSQSLMNNAERDVQELDLNLSYSIGGLSATLTDYWWGGLHNPYGYYSDKAAITDFSLKATKDVEAITLRQQWLTTSALNCLLLSVGQHGLPEPTCVQTAISVATQLKSMRHTTSLAQPT